MIPEPAARTEELLLADPLAHRRSLWTGRGRGLNSPWHIDARSPQHGIQREEGGRPLLLDRGQLGRHGPRFDPLEPAPPLRFFQIRLSRLRDKAIQKQKKSRFRGGSQLTGNYGWWVT